MLYESILKPILFQFDPEGVHHFIKSCAAPLNFSVLERACGALYTVKDSRLAVHTAGLNWKNPIGLAAGFDKDAEMVGLFSALGFGHLELGTVTGHPQPGNDRPRIFRLPNDHALINRMGFPSQGAEVMAQRLMKIHAARRGDPIIGINIGKTKAVEIERAVSDYLLSFSLVSPYADYVAVNVSSPNTQGLRQLQAKENLSELLQQLMQANKLGKPIFVKLAPDLTDAELDDALECCEQANVAGVIATNTTVSRPKLVDGERLSPGGKPLSSEQGGLSGVPLRAISPVMVRKVAQRVGKEMTVIGVGGISTVNDVIAMLSAGADLVQIYTALVYCGPGLVARLNQELLQICDQLKLTSIGDFRLVSEQELAGFAASATAR